MTSLELIGLYLNGGPSEREAAAAELERLAAATVEHCPVVGHLVAERDALRAELAEVRAERDLHVEAAVRASGEVAS